MTTQEQTDVAAHLAAGRLARSQGNLAEAIRCYREAIRLQPEFVPTYNNLANALQAKDAQKIINAFRSSDCHWIVAVGMISGGTDIPRLQMCCYLSRIRTELH